MPIRGPATITRGFGRLFAVEGNSNAVFDGLIIDGGFEQFNAQGGAMKITGGANVDLEGMVFENNYVNGATGR
ncbi:MAG TPA: hypothetical protein VKA46_10145 [Gemmataceae bacterium]|nr:hypothetical protein [Gemmataceae bacterium]